MSEANVKAEAILIVIKRILKWIGFFIVGIAIFALVADQYSSYEARKRQEIEDKVVIQAYHPKEGPCSEDYPYQYTIVNNSGKTIENVRFTVGIKRKGFSSDLNGYTSINEDKIIPHNEGYGRCFRAVEENDYKRNLTEKDVDIEIKYKNVTFKK